MKYRREIDGLRALAVVPVILFHAGFPTFSGGFVGVDVFFVISGYLITRIISDEMETNSFSLLRFYERRARRILPALFFVLACTLPFAWFWLLPTDLRKFAQSLVAVPVFASNILFSLTTDYFDTTSEIKPLLHTWSLAVEEQYYILFPLLLLATWKVGRRNIIVSLSFIAALSLLTAHWASEAYPSFSFYLLPTRAFEILIGSIFALCFKSIENTSPRNESIDQVLSISGLGLIAYAVFCFDRTTPSPSLYTLIPTLGTGLIIAFSTPTNLAGILLGNRLLVGIGLASYSAYLWHQPLFAFARLRSLTALSGIELSLLAALSMIMGLASYRLVERPLRNRFITSRTALVALSLAGSILFMIIGLFAYLAKGIPSRLPNQIIDVSVTSELMNIPRLDNGWCFYSIDSIRTLSIGKNGLACHLGSKIGETRNGLLFGDSFAGSYEPFWHVIGTTSNSKIHSVTTNWCLPTFDKSFSGPRSSRSYEQCLFNRKYLEEHHSKYDFIVLAGMWSEAYRNDRLESVISLINFLAPTSKFIIVMPSPKQYDKSPVLEYAKHQWFEGSRAFKIEDIDHKRDDMALEANDMLQKEAEKHRNVVFLRRESVFNMKELSSEGIPLSTDGAHLSIYGSVQIAQEFVRGKAFEGLFGDIK